MKSAKLMLKDMFPVYVELENYGGSLDGLLAHLNEVSSCGNTFVKIDNILYNINAITAIYPVPEKPLGGVYDDE